ncbi:MAG: MFS transporter [Spirochaetes bacterium]|jgi:MFS family permease|nr:MFS transporter [Spirochaetota bacterium]
MKKYSLFSLLAAIMFLQVGIQGAYRPIMSTYLTKTLGFGGTQASIIIAMTVVSGIFSPLAASFFVDRIIKARHLLALLHLVAAIFSVFTAYQTTFASVLISYLLYMAIFAPTMGLVNAVTFKNLKTGREHFGTIRVFGTLGWVASGLVFGQIYVNQFKGPVSNMFILAAIMGVGISILSLFLPDIPLPPYKPKSLKDIIPMDAFRTVARPELLSLIVIFFLSSTMDRFYYFGTGPYLEYLGYSYGNNLAMQTLGQAFEIISIPLLGFFLGGFLINRKNLRIGFKGIGFKKSFIIGLSFQVLRYGLFMTSGDQISTIIALLCNGFIYTFFYATATIYVDTLCNDTNRAGVHQLINMIFFGFSGIFGTLTAGFLSDYYSKDGVTNYFMFWMTPTVISVITIILTIIFIRDIPVKSKKRATTSIEDDNAIGPHESV